MTITGERARVLDFSSPYFDASQALVVAEGSGSTTLDDLAGKRIGVQGGTTGELYVTDNAPEASADVVPFEDAAAMDDRPDRRQRWTRPSTTTPWSATWSANNPDLEVAAEFDTGEQYGMAVKKDGNVDLLRTINDVLAELKANGGYDKIYKKYF